MKFFPCLKCHQSYRADFSENSAEKHPNMVFKHMPEVKECRLCHSTVKPNQLNLLDGTIVKIDEMSQLCGQCHGKIEYDWGRGLHGKITGSWRDKRSRLLCSECHNPHAPKFPFMEAVSTPFQSEYVIPKEGHNK